MIAFDLQCVNGHTFEGWFKDGRAYEEQNKKGLIACPVCDDTDVYKIPSTFAIKSSPQEDNYSALPTPRIDMEALGNKIVDYVEKNFDDVGADFTKEALKIHYGVSEPRNIRGVSTREEEKTLEKEGVQFIKIPIPVPPDTDS
jgi:hypothetical protein